MQTVLVTGGAGYVGSGFLRRLLMNGYRVVCVDRLMFGGESIIDLWNERNFIFYNCDINDHETFGAILKDRNYDAVVHLAAIVGDPACKRDPELSVLTNWNTPKWLLDRCVELEIPRFIFASTCSNYGRNSDPNSFLTEASELAPVSLYAELKVKIEKYILEHIPRSDYFSPTILRFSTVYGLSPRMRFDLTVNEFTKELTLGNDLVVFGEQFWRPYCHVKDFSGALITVLEAQREKVAFDVFNVGNTDENYTKKLLVDELIRQIPSSIVRYVKREEDPRDYRVNCDKISKQLGFKTTMKVSEGIAEIREILELGIILDPNAQRYYNIPHLDE